jgi:NAD-specific glutamate dehydrogenase
LYGAVQETLVARMVWFLRNADVGRPLDEQVVRFAAGVAAVSAAGGSLIANPALRQTQIDAWLERGVPADLAARIVDLPALEAATDGVLIAEQSGASVADGVATLFAATDALGVGRLRQAGLGLRTTDRFERLAIDRALERTDLALRTISVDVIRSHGGGITGLQHWQKGRAEALPLDLASLASVRSFAASVAGGDPVDILILNAGIQNVTDAVSADGFELSFAVNHLAHYLLVRLLLPRI